MKEPGDDQKYFMKGFNHAFILATENSKALSEIEDGIKGSHPYALGFIQGAILGKSRQKNKSNKPKRKGGFEF